MRRARKEAASTHHSTSTASEQELLQQYSSIKHLISAKRYDQALSQGWKLLEGVKPAYDAKSSSRCLQELFAASSLNVLICMAEKPDLAALRQLNGAVSGIFDDLRQQTTTAAAAAAMRQAVMLSKCLLKVVVVVGQELAAQQHPSTQQQSQLQELLMWLVGAAWLCGQAQLPQQVALKASQDLPSCLQHCVLAAFANAAQSCNNSSSSSHSHPCGSCSEAPHTPWGVPPEVYIACMQHVASNACWDDQSAAACVCSVLGPLRGISIVPELQATLVLLLAAACSRSLGQLPNTAVDLLTAAAHSTSQDLQQQVQDMQRNDAAAAGACAGARPAEQAACSSLLQQEDSLTLQLALLRAQSWAGKHLVTAGLNMQQAVCPLLVSLAVEQVAARQLACMKQQEQPQPQQGGDQESLARQQQQVLQGELTAGIFSYAVQCLARWWTLGSQQQGNCVRDTAAQKASNGQQTAVHRKQAAAGFEQQVLQQLRAVTAALGQLIPWQHVLKASTQPAGSVNSTALSLCDAHTLSLLEQVLHMVAVSVDTTTSAATNVAGSSRSSNSDSSPAVAAALWLQAVICRCALAVHAADTPNSCAAWSRRCRAVGLVLDAAKALLNHMCRSQQLSDAGPAAAYPAATGANLSTAAVGRPMPGDLPKPAGPHMLQWAQDIMLLSARMVLQLPNAQQQQLKQQWQSVLRSYSRLRCAAAGAGCSIASSTQASGGHGAHGEKGCSRSIKQAAECLSLCGVQEQLARLACDDMPAASRQQHQLPSVLELVTTAAAAAVTAADGPAGTAGPLALCLDRLWVLEGTALSQVASSSVLEASAAAAQQLFLQLLANTHMSAQQSPQGLQGPHTLLARGMLLLLLPGGNSPGSSTGVEQARLVLAQACQQLQSVLPMPDAALKCVAWTAGASKYGCGAKTSATPHRGSSGPKSTGKPAAAGASRRQATRRQQQEQQCQVSDGASDTDGTAPAAAVPNTLLSAALCHCLLGLLLAASISTTAAVTSSTPARSAAEDSGQPACDNSPAGMVAAADNSVPDAGLEMAMPSWLNVAECLHSGSGYLQAYLAAVQASKCSSSPGRSVRTSNGSGSSSGSSQLMWHADEAAVALMQAWHVAALQDWCHCQQSYLQVLNQLAGSLSKPTAQHVTQFLALALQQHSTGGVASRPWLMQLVQQQAVAPTAAPAAAAEDQEGFSRACPGAAAAGVASARTNSRSTVKQNSNTSSTRTGEASASRQQQAGCCCQLRAHAQALQEVVMSCGQQSHKADREGSGWQCLAQAQVQIAAAEAAMWSGDAAAAAVEAELALQACRSVLASVDSPSIQSKTGSTEHCSTRGSASQWVAVGAWSSSGNAGLKWHALGLYMSSLWQLSGTLEAAGNPQEAVRLLKELHRLSSSRGIFSFAVLTQAGLSSIYSRMAQPAKAESAASAAGQQLQVFKRLHKADSSSNGAGSCVYALAAAAVSSAQAAVALGKQQVAAAQEHLDQGLAVLDMLQAVHAGGVAHVGWRWVAQHVQLLQQRAQCQALLQDRAAALAAVQAAAKLLGFQHTRCSRCPCGPWPTLWASVQLQLMSMQRPPSSACSSSACGLGLAGFQTGSHSNDLLQEFTAAAAAAAGAPVKNSTAGEDSSASSRRTGRGRAAATNGKNAAAAAFSTARRKASHSTVQGHSEPKGTSEASLLSLQPGEATSGNEYAEGQDTAAWLCRTLQAACLTCQHPLLLRRACMLLCDAFQGLGAVNAAAMFLHIALGASTTQRQLMLAVSRRRQAANTPDHVNNQCSSSATTPAEPWARMQPLLSYARVLADAAAAAQGACAAADDTSSSLQGLAQAVDTAALSWLTATLQQLPQGVAVCSISRAADCVPASCEGVLVSRVVLGGGADSCARVLLVQLPAPGSSNNSRRPGSSMCDLLCELQAVLADASTSMAAASSSSLTSTATKSAWWRQRLSQDQRMAALIQTLDQDLLGAWRCLLLPRAQPQVEAAAAAASQTIVADHFDCVLDEKPKQLLGQMVALLIVHLGSCTTAELTHAAQQLSTLAQQRMDGLHLQRLLADLAAAHASLPVPAPACAAPQLQASSSCSSAANTAPKTPARSSSSSSNARSASVASKARAASTNSLPADANAKLLSTPANRKPLSRCNAGDTSDPMASRGFFVLGTSGARQGGMHVLDAAPHTHRKNSIAGASLPAAATAMDVPPSIARHASRRSRLKAMHSAGTSNVSAVPLPTNTASQISSRKQQRCDVLLEDCAVVSTATSCRPDCSSSSTASPTKTLPCPAARSEAPAGWQGQPSAVLVLDQYMQGLPWESCPGLKQHSLYRCPGLAFAAALAARLQTLQESDSALQLSSSFYVLNPDGDLADTQHSFEDTLKRLCREGMAGSRPIQSRLVSALQQHDLFLYFGHGAGEQYLSAAAYRRLDCCAASLLMGCSSGRLRPAGEFEPHGPAWDYLMAGSPAVVANLWDVTDRDIDRFAAKVLQEWGGADDDSGGAGDGGLADRDAGSGLVDMSAAISASREACRLPALVGGAAVCCGLPASVQKA